MNITHNWMTIMTTATTDNFSVPEGCIVLGRDTGGYVPWDNPDNIITEDVERATATAVEAVCLPVFFLISAPTNVLNMLVFWKQGLKERVNLCLFYLSAVDFGYMLHAFIANVDRLYLPFNASVNDGTVFQFLVKHRLLGFRSLYWLSGFVSMLIACDRCWTVVNPLRSQSVLSAGKTGWVLVFFTVFSLTGSILNGMRWSLVCVFDAERNDTSLALRTSQFFLQHRVRMNVLTLFFATIQPFVYVAVITATTIVTSVKLKAMVAWREGASMSRMMSPREVTLTRMLVAASVLYIVCVLPTSVLGLGLLFLPEITLNGRYYNLGQFLVRFFHLAGYTNATFNFFVYVSLGSKYRKTLRSLFSCCVKVDAVPRLSSIGETKKEVWGSDVKRC